MRRSRVVLVAAAAYAGGLALVLLWPVPVDRDVDVLGSWPVRALAEAGLSPERGYDVVQVAANVVLFIPLGLLVVLLVRRATAVWALAVGAGVSAAAELVQAVARPERVASWPDVVANAAGAGVGALLGLLVRRRARRPVRGG